MIVSNQPFINVKNGNLMGTQFGTALYVFAVNFQNRTTRNGQTCISDFGFCDYFFVLVPQTHAQ
jgi:hypothetical protein